MALHAMQRLRMARVCAAWAAETRAAELLCPERRLMRAGGLNAGNRRPPRLRSAAANPSRWLVPGSTLPSQGQPSAQRGRGKRARARLGRRQRQRRRTLSRSVPSCSAMMLRTSDSTWPLSCKLESGAEASVLGDGRVGAPKHARHPAGYRHSPRRRARSCAARAGRGAAWPAGGRGCGQQDMAAAGLGCRGRGAPIAR